MGGVNMGEILEAVAVAQPEASAQVQGERRTSWAEFERRSRGLARFLVGQGLERQDKVAQYLYNSPEYLESMAACVRASFVPVNTNYRYREAELLYLWDNADVVGVMFHGCFAERIEGLRGKLPKIRSWLCVDDGSGPFPEWAVPYEEAVGDDGELELEWEIDGDDLIIVYTGGTTGMPKGVMWRQDDYFSLVNRERPQGPYDPEGGFQGFVEKKRAEGPGRVMMPACPQMHALALMGSFTNLVNGGCVVTACGRRFDAAETLDLVEKEGVNQLSIVGDAFARPLLEALDAEPLRWDLSSLLVVRSAGVMWSHEVKKGLLKHHPDMVLIDGLGSTEAPRIGRSESTGENASTTAIFDLGETSAVFDDDLNPVEPGSGVVGRLAVGGAIPSGYYKDEAKTAATFLGVDGVRYSVPGDYATVEADGSVRLLGRGSVCINTGGEKVYPEEVEEVLKRHESILDAVCVGVPHERFGESIVALVEPSGSEEPSEAGVIEFVRALLAGYKAPHYVLTLDSIGRAPNGKVDYKGLRQIAVERLQAR
jgi:acyl-CoA synthetase (AMP-forming)/AMP-acid ligase II